VVVLVMMVKSAPFSSKRGFPGIHSYMLTGDSKEERNVQDVKQLISAL
jgi:hypothetical protein